jgi:hypothetical protein
MPSAMQCEDGENTADKYKVLRATFCEEIIEAADAVYSILPG